MELIEVFWCMFGLIMGFVCCHMAYKGTEDDGDNQRHSEGELDRDNDVRIYLPVRIRSGQSNNGRNQRMEPEEKAIVLKVILHDYQRTLSPGEKRALQEMIEDLDADCDPEHTDGILKGLDEAVGRFDKLTRLWKGEK